MGESSNGKSIASMKELRKKAILEAKRKKIDKYANMPRRGQQSSSAADFAKDRQNLK